MVQFELEEVERQAVLLAIAELALERPGWDAMLGEIAAKLDPPGGSINKGRVMYSEFKRLHADRVRECRLPTMPMVLQQDDLPLRNWVFGALHPHANAGSFVTAFAEACQRADPFNYPLLRPALIALALKYPDYAKFDAVDNPTAERTP